MWGGWEVSRGWDSTNPRKNGNELSALSGVTVEQRSMLSSPEQRTEQELRRELQANVAAVGACYPSAEALREEAAEAERLAARDSVVRRPPPSCGA